MSYQDLNGHERNVAKLKEEWLVFRLVMKPYFKEWLKAPWNMHHYVDLFVESGRVSKKHPNYLMGHFWAIYFPLSILLIIL